MKNRHESAYVYLLITFFLWGSLYVVSRFVLGKLPTFTVAFFRFVIAFCTLSVMMYGQKKCKIRKEDWKYVIIIGFVGYTVAVGAQLLGTKLAGSSMASLINSLNPVAIAIAGAIYLKEKLTKKKVAGSIIAFCGVFIIVGMGGSINLLGMFLSLAAVAGWSFMSVMTRKVAQKYDSLTVTRAALGIAAVCNLPVGIGQLLLERNTVTVDLSTILGIFYMGIFCTGVAYILWNRSLSMLEAGTCSAFYPIQPLVSTFLGIIFLKETVGISFYIGAVFIVAGVLISLLPWRNMLYHIRTKNNII